MRISLNWLSELVDLTMTPDELAETLTMAGFEVEDIEDRRAWANGVVVGNVLDCKPHPNADKLRVCTVEIGRDTPSTIVCGASNVKTDTFVPVATIGTYLPIVDLKIRPRKLRDVPSEGMICSLAELGLAKESEGIHIFSEANLKPGDDARPLLGLDDVVLDLTSTANRADALSMVGIAREISAITGAQLHLPEVPPVSIQTQGRGLAVTVAEPQACPAYIGTQIENVTIAPSPRWLQQRLQASGIRPINNVVDVTNYILLEWGQPLHAFDADRLSEITGHDSLTIGVRFAHSSESLKTLDGQVRKLSEQSLLITANDKPVALAGVMGGEETEVYDGTTRLVLEAAIFDPVATRRSARSQGLRSEASTRYERGVNQAELDLACRRALLLMGDLSGGTLHTQAIADHLPDFASFSRTIELRLERINHVLGPIAVTQPVNGAGPSSASDIEPGELTAGDVEHVLTALGCQLTPASQPNVWTVSVPPYRYRDLEREIDLIEEVARLYGYNKFCDTLPDKSELGYLSVDYALTQEIRAAFQAVGLTELIHYSLVRPGFTNQIELANPLFAEYSALRTELLPGLIDAFQYNLEKGCGTLNGFEIGRVFWRAEDGFDEADRVAGIIGGDTRSGRWVSGGREAPLTWFEAKGMLESAFQRLGLSVEYQPDCRRPELHPGRTASLWVQGQRLGTFGQLHPQLRQERELPDQVYVFELDLDVMLDQMDQEERINPIFKPFSTYPSSARDIALYSPIQVSVAELKRAIQKAGTPLLESVELFDEYRGQGVPEGKRSLAFRLIYRASDRTLTDVDVDPVHANVRDSLAEKFGVELRS
ncbi:MAG: phenylalanine--tRNA ligase subunit beta [Elainellaceae cyanobacterium]